MSDTLVSTSSESLKSVKSLDNYATALTQLKPENVSALSQLVADDMHFSDPFNSLYGKADFLGVMAEMFEQLDDVSFELMDSQIEANSGYLYWRFSASSSLTGQFSAEGCSRICFNEQWLVSSHQDFWDASLLMQQFPLLGRVIRMIRKRAAYKEL